MLFRSLYAKTDHIFSLEFFPPRSEENLGATLQTVDELNGLNPDLMTVTYGAMGGSRNLSKAVLTHIAKDLQKPAVAHLTCVGHSRSEINQTLDEFETVGVKAVLALRGDPPKGSTTFEPHPDGFNCARDLVAFIKDTRPHLSVAVAGYPETHSEAMSPQADLAYLKEKVDAGAELIYTQLFFEPQIYFHFVNSARAIGIEVPIVPGVMPIANVGQVRRFTSMCGATIPLAMQRDLDRCESDPEAVRNFGIDYATRQCQVLLEGGAPGIHFYTLNRCQQIGAIFEALVDGTQSRHRADLEGCRTAEVSL
jgi:methylenetetrahydrofolate reductase (NADPH)